MIPDRPGDPLEAIFTLIRNNNGRLSVQQAAHILSGSKHPYASRIFRQKSPRSFRESYGAIDAPWYKITGRIDDIVAQGRLSTRIGKLWIPGTIPAEKPATLQWTSKQDDLLKTYVHQDARKGRSFRRSDISAMAAVLSRPPYEIGLRIRELVLRAVPAGRDAATDKELFIPPPGLDGFSPSRILLSQLPDFPLYRSLHAWLKRQSKKRRVRESQLLDYKALGLITRIRPTTPEALRDILGGRADSLGQACLGEILTLVLSHRKAAPSGSPRLGPPQSL